MKAISKNTQSMKPDRSIHELLDYLIVAPIWKGHELELETLQALRVLPESDLEKLQADGQPFRLFLLISLALISQEL